MIEQLLSPAEMGTPEQGQPIWLDNGQPMKPEKFIELVLSGVIDTNTAEGASACLAWAKKYQHLHGRQSFNLTRDIECYTGVPYNTLYDRTKKWLQPKAKDV